MDKLSRDEQVFSKGQFIGSFLNRYITEGLQTLGGILLIYLSEVLLSGRVTGNAVSYPGWRKWIALLAQHADVECFGVPLKEPFHRS